MANEFVVKNGLITPTVQLPGATSGTVTISAPAVAGTTTIALPATAGTIVTTGDTGTVTNTMLAGSIANNKLANSTISGTALGGTLPTATFNVSGTGLSGSATYNGTTASTFTVTSNATSANTVSTIVSRDASGNFSAGTITAALNGNASTASTLQTARTITLSGDVAGSVSFNGSTDVSITTTIQPNSVALGTDTTGNYVATVAVSGTGLSVSGSGVENAAVTVTSNATNANTASTIVARDASGNFSAGTITAALSGNASTASALQTARTISLTGDVTGSVSFDGSGNAAIATTIQPDSVSLGTDTTGNYMVNVAAGTGVSVSHTQGEGSTATVSIGQPVGTTDNVTFNSVTVNGTLTSDDITSTNISIAGNATITGNLTVSGTTTTVNSTAVSIADINIELARTATTAAEANGAGLTVTGPTTAATLTYTSADDRWNFNKNLNVGTVFGALSGNASTASTWQTARTLSLAGDLSGSVSINGGANVTLTATIAANSVALGTDTTGNYVADITAGNAITVSGGGAENATITVNHADTSSVANQTAATNTFVSGITFDTYGHVQTITTGSPSGFLTGNQTITLTGDTSGSGATSISTTTSYLTSSDDRIKAPSDDAAGKLRFGFTSWTNNNTSPWADYLHLRSYTDSSGGSDNLVMFRKDAIGIRVWQQTWGSATAYATYKDVAFTDQLPTVNDGTLSIGTATAGATNTTVALNLSGAYSANTANNRTINAVVGPALTNLATLMTTAGAGFIRRGATADTYTIDTNTYLTAESDTLATVTGRGASTSNSVTLSGMGNQLGGHFYFIAYDAAGNHYPHFNDGGSASGSKVNWRLFTGATNSITHVWRTDYTYFANRVESASDMRATLFYDASDTSFYVDPANTGTSARFAGQIVVEDGIRTRTSGYGSPYNLFALSDTYDSATYYGIKYIEGNPDVIQVIGGNNVGLSIGMDVGDTTASSSLRAPIFYDSNNTGYYLDPNSGTSLVVAGIVKTNADRLVLRDDSIEVHATDNDSAGVAINYYGYAGGTTRFRDFNVYDGKGGLRFKTYGSANYAYSPSSFRAPIFYDSDDTNYYTDPASTSVINALTVSTINNIKPKTDVWHQSNEGKERFYFSPNSTTYYRTGANFVFRNNSDSGVITIDGSGNLRTTTGGDNYASYSLHVGGTGFASSDFRSPIFYDSNDTGYYWDGASTSKWNESNQNGWHTFNNYGTGVTGTYDSYRLQTVFAMGSAYRMASDGSATNNMYGLAWSHPNAGSLGGANNLNDHGLLIINNGTFRAALSSRAVFSADVRGTLFYDYNDTNYYVDPNSTSRIRRTNLIASGSGWDDGLNLYSSDATNRWNFLVDDGASDSLRIAYNNSEAFNINTSRNVTVSVDIRAPIFYDSNNTAFYADPASTSVFNQLTVDGDPVITATHSGSDFINGTLVQTDIDSSVTNGDSFRLEATGKSYGAGIPFMFMAEGYLYNNGIINFNGVHLGHNGFSTMKIFNNNGTLAFWWPRVSYWNSFEVRVISASGSRNTNQNRVTSITDVAEPSGATVTKKVTVNMAYYMRGDTSSSNADTIRAVNFRASNAYYLGENNYYFNNTNSGWYSNVKIQSESDMRAPIFYDSNDTNYYCDPNGSSRLNEVYPNQIYNYGWFRNQSSGQGLYNTANDAHFYSAGANYWHINGDSENITYGGLIFYDRYNSSQSNSTGRKGYVYWDSAGFGFLDSTGNWSINIHPTNYKRVTIGGGNYLNPYDSVTGIRLMFGGSDDNAADNYYIGTNLENFGGNYNKLDIRWHTGIRIGAQPGYGGVRIYDSEDMGTVRFSINKGDANTRVESGSFYAPIMYDIDNSTYYIDPNSTTSIRTVGSWRSDSSTWDGEFSGKIQYHSNSWYFQAADAWYFRNSAGTNVATINSSGYIFGSYFNASSGNSENPTIGQIWTQNTGDNYLRKSTPAHFISQLGLVTTSVLDNNDRTYLTDSRGAARLPSYYDDRYAQWDFQNTSDTGAGGDTWHGLLTVAKWTVYDASHRQEQIAFTGNDLKRRTATSDSAWGSWKTIWDSGNLTNLNQLTNGPGYLTGTKVDSIAATSPIATSAATGAVTLSHANSGVTAGTYNNVTVNATGHVTSGSNVSYLTGTKVDSISATSPIVASASTGAVTLSHANSGVTAATYNNVTVNATGHVTSGSNVSYLTAEADTFATVTGRGSSTSTAISISNDVTASQFYVNGWFRNNANGTGLYNQNTTQHLSSTSNGYWDMSSTTTVSSIRFYTGGHLGVLRGYVYADTTSSIGFLNTDGNWRFRVVSNDYSIADGTSMRAQMFYDSNDTAFYVDPANPSVMEYVEGSNACSFRGANRAINDWNYTGLTTNPTVNSYDDGSWYIDAGNSGDWSRGLLSKRRFRRTVGLTLEYEIYQQDNSGTGFGTRSMVGFVNGDSTNYSYNQTPSNMTYHDNGGLFVYTNGTSSGTDYNIDARNSWYKFKTILRGSGANHYVWHNSEWRLIKSTTTNDQNSYEWLRICVSISAQRVYFRNMKVYDAEGMVLAGSAVSDYYIDRVPGRFYVATDVRSPGFYDSDNSSYYLDPSSTGTSLAVRGMITSGSTGALGGGEIQIYGSNGNLILKPSINSTAAEIASAASTGIIFKANNSSVAQISSSGIISSSNITAYGSPSDRRLKENIEPLTNSLQKVMALEGVSFNWKKDTKEHTMVGLNKDIGLIAQNVQQVLPDLVREEEDGTLSLRDRGLVAVLIEAIKEQQSEIDELKALVRQLLAK